MGASAGVNFVGWLAQHEAVKNCLRKLSWPNDTRAWQLHNQSSQKLSQLRPNTWGWQPNDKNRRQSAFALRIRHVCAHCELTLFLTDIYQAKAHGLLIHIRNCVTAAHGVRCARARAPASASASACASECGHAAIKK